MIFETEMVGMDGTGFQYERIEVQEDRNVGAHL